MLVKRTRPLRQKNHHRLRLSSRFSHQYTQLRLVAVRDNTFRVRYLAKEWRTYIGQDEVATVLSMLVCEIPMSLFPAEPVQYSGMLPPSRPGPRSKERVSNRIRGEWRRVIVCWIAMSARRSHSVALSWWRKWLTTHQFQVCRTEENCIRRLPHPLKRLDPSLEKTWTPMREIILQLQWLTSTTAGPQTVSTTSSSARRDQIHTIAIHP